ADRHRHRPARPRAVDQRLARFVCDISRPAAQSRNRRTMSLRSNVAMVGGLAAAVMIPELAAASPRARLTLDAQVAGAPARAPAPVGGGGGALRPPAPVPAPPADEILADAGPPGGPGGFAPAEIQSAYQIDPAKAKPATVAIVDAYGYANLESDLATYRAQF